MHSAKALLPRSSSTPVTSSACKSEDSREREPDITEAGHPGRAAKALREERQALVSWSRKKGEPVMTKIFNDVSRVNIRSYKSPVWETDFIEIYESMEASKCGFPVFFFQVQLLTPVEPR